MKNSFNMQQQMKGTLSVYQLPVFILLLSLFAALSPGLAADPQNGNIDELAAYDEQIFAEDKARESIADPLEPLNRVFFQFNDLFYFVVLKPVASVYSAVLPDDVRICIRNAYDNILVPVRVVNNLLQGKMNNSGTELSRFVINSTIGVAGLGDPAASSFGLKAKDEDLGQTLGVFGLGDGMYLCWPVLGPSNVRDSIGLAGDLFLDPLSYLLVDDRAAAAWVYAGKRVNQTSLTLGDYELLKETSMDPYAALRDVYQQYRHGKIRE